MSHHIQRRQVLAALGALAAAGPLGARAQANAPINLGYQNTSWGSIAMVAEAEKTFEKAGANIKTFQFDGGKSTRDAMVAGRVDIGVLGATPFIVGAAKGDIIAIATSMYAGRTNAIVAAKDSGIKTIADLKGKRVASQLGSATDNVFQNKILPKYGLSKSDIQVVNVAHQNNIASMVGKSVDAFAGVEPFPSLAEVEGLGTVLLDYAEFDIQPVFIGVTAPTLEKKRDAVVAFMRGWLAAAKIVTEDRPRAARIVWNHFKNQGFDLKEAVVTRMMGKLDVSPNYRPDLRQYLQAEATSMIAQKQIAAAPDWNKVLDTSVLAAAMKA
jgi:aliphatic sulfonates family ABC transporter substrate-binding protein